jgi:hypothetical protein
VGFSSIGLVVMRHAGPLYDKAFHGHNTVFASESVHFSPTATALPGGF